MDFRQFELLARQPSAALRERRTFWGLSKRGLAFMLVNMMFWQPLVAMADGIVPSGPGTSVGQAGNGVPIVNIAAPNGSGLSHNTFNDYNVGQHGLILNNATDRTQATQLGGIILGNPNLNGRSANVILNEVNGGSPSQLRGYTEVAGQSAHVIVANPYGVTCNGCGFINTPKATLTTGKPVIENGQLQRYQVEQGSVAIEGAGLNASNIDQFEIITRSAKVNAQIQAKHLAVVTGANDVDARTLDARARNANPDNAPQLAIDASALGGMYANTIKLVGTEAGVGVKLDGQMIASGGDMQIDANGQLRMAEASAAKGSVAINAASLDAQGTVYAGKELKVRTQGDLTNRTSLSAGERVDLASGTRLSNQGVIEAGVNADNTRNANGDLQITAQHLDNRGKNLLASGTLNATVTQALDNQGGTLSGQRQVTVNAGSLDNRNKGKVASSSGSVEATVSGELRNSGGGTLVSQQTLSVKAANLDNSGGILSSAGEQHLTASNLLNNAQGGLIDSGAALTLNAMTLGNTGGGITATEALRVIAHNLDNSGGSLAGKGEVRLTLMDALTNTQGKLSSAGPLRLEGTAAVANHGGQIVSDGLMSLFASSLVNTQGTLQSQGLLSLTTGDISNDGGRITAQDGDAHITAGNVDNREGGLYAKGLVKVSANDFDNSGQVAGQQLDFDLSGALNNRQGIIESDSTLAIKAASLDNQAGQLRTLGRTGNTRFAIDGLLDNRSGTLESASHDLGLGAGGFLNTGGSLLHVGLGTFDIATGTVTGAGGSIVTHGSLALNADSWSNSSVIQAGRLTVNVGNFSQTATGQLLAGQALVGSGGTWVNDGLIASDGSLSLDLDGGYSGNGRLSSRDTLGLSAGQLTLGSTATIAGGADTTVQVAGQLNNAGRITTAGNLGLSAASVHNQGTLAATGNLTLGTGALSNERGLLFSGGDMALRVNSLTNSYADVYSLGSLTIDRDGQGGLASSIVNRSGSLQSDGAMSLAAASIQNVRAVLETSDQGAYTARISEVACIEGYNAGDCSGKRNHVWEIVQRDKFEVTEASAASSITTGSNLAIKGSELLNSSSTIAAAGNLTIAVDNLTNSGVQTGETETTRIFMSARTRNGGAWYDAANAFNSQYWYQNPGYNPNNLAGLQGAMASFIGMTEQEWVSLGSRRTLAVGDQRYAGVIQAGGTVSINAANGIDSSVVRPGYSYIGSGARTDTSAPGTAFSTRISLNQHLPPDLAQQQLNPLALPDFTLPEGQNGLFRLTGDSANAVIGSGVGSSAHKYLIETNPALTDLKQFMSSDYLLANLGYDPDDSAKRLGDGFYEQRLIQQALVARTGQRLLDGQNSDEALFKHLMDNALQSKQQLDLALGVSLTSAQVAALTHDIVWLENAEVNGEQVLVPVLYLANANHRLAANGALIAGSDVSLIAGQKLDSVGTLRASNTLSAQAGNDLVNSGLLEAGNRLDLQAGNDLVNKAGGIIAGRDVSLSAGQDVINERTLTSHQSSNGSYAQQRDFVDNAARVEATNNLVVNAGRDVLNRGGVLSSGADTSIKAGRDVSLTSVAQRVSNDHGVRHNNSSVTQNGSSVQAGRDLTISAGRDVTAVASLVEAKRDLAMTAVGDLSLVSAANEQHSATKTRKVTAQDDRVTQVASTVTAGGNLNLRAGEDLTLVASQAKAGKEAYLYAGNDVELLAAHDESYSYYKKKKEGSFGKSSTRMTESASSVAVSSVVEGAQGVDLVAKRDVNVQASRVISDEGDLAVTAGRDVNLLATTSSSSSASASSKSGGLGLSSTSKAKSQSSTVTVVEGSTLSGNTTEVQAGRDISVVAGNVVSTEKTTVSAAGDIRIDSAVESESLQSSESKRKSGLMSSGGIGITLGSAKNTSTQQSHTELNKGSTIGSVLGDVDIEAGKDLSIRASDVVAGKDVNLIGQNVSILAAQNHATSEQKQTSSKSGLTLALSGVVGSAINTTYETAKAARSEDDSRLAALQGVKAGLSGYQAWQAAQGLQSGAQEGQFVGIALSLGTQKSSSSQRSEQVASQGSSLTSGGNLSVVATGKGALGEDGDIHVQGSQLKTGKDLLLAANRDIVLESGGNTQKLDGKNKSGGGNVGISFGVGSSGAGLSLFANANTGTGTEKGNGTTWSETTLDAGGKASLVSGRDTGLVGAQVNAERIEAKVGRDLLIRSQQDSDRYDSKQLDIAGGVSVTLGTGGSGYLAINNQKLHSNYDSVQEQSGLFAGKGGYDVEVGKHTQLDGAVIASSADASKNHLSTGTLGWSELNNKAEFKTQGQNLSVSGGGSVGEQFTGNMGSVMAVGVNRDGSASGTTRSAVSEGTLEVRDTASQQQDVASLSRDPASANDSISPIFDKEKEQRRLRTVQLIGEISTQAMDVIRTEGDLRAFEAGKRVVGERKPNESASTYGERVRNSAAYQVAMSEYGTGSDMQRAAQAVTAALQGLAGGNLAGALAGASAPYVAEQIKRVAGDNDAARLMAHAVLGALVAQTQGSSAAAGAAGAVGGELIATQIMERLYPNKSASDLDEREKQIVSGLSTLAAGLSGAVVGGDASSAVAGAGAGKNAVENNHLSFDGRLVLKKAEQDYASGCGGASAGSNDCQQLADKITELRKLGESVLETEHTVVGSELGPDQFTTSKPGDIVACASGFCRVTDEVVQTSAGKEYKLVEATEAEAAGKAQQNEMAAARSEMEVKRFLSEAYESGCGGAGPGAVACQIHRSLGAANPVTGYEPTTEERVLAGASAILNTLGLVGVVRGGGLGGGASGGAVGSGAKATAADAGSVFSQQRTFWSKDPISFNGNKVYQRDDLFEPAFVSSWREGGKVVTGTNIERMASGRAPIGADGKSVNLHHTTQTQYGPIAEMTQTFHQQNSAVIHINPNTIPSGINRAVFDKWKVQYWKERAAGYGGAQ